MRLRDIGEFRLLDQIIAGLECDEAGSDPGNVVVGPGDDAAAVNFAAASSPGDLLLLAADTMVEETHFLPVSRLTAADIRDVGYKSVAVNISDIAAMAGVPLYLLMSISAPGDMEADLLKELMRGARQCAGEFGARIVGGDLTRSPQLTISVAITGKAPRDSLCRRGGARPGDVILVTGTVGDSAAGLALIKGETPQYQGVPRPLSQADADYLKGRHMRPTPRIAEAAILAASGVRTMIDISDGLIQDLGHICEHSGVAARVDAEEIPVSDQLLRFTDRLDALTFSSGGGEDYEIIAVCAPEIADIALARFDYLTATKLSVVGVIIERQEGAGLIDAGPLTTEGWDSFTDER